MDFKTCCTSAGSWLVSQAWCVGIWGRVGNHTRGGFGDDESLGSSSFGRVAAWRRRVAGVVLRAEGAVVHSGADFERTLPFPTDGGGNGSARGVGVQFEGRAKRMGG